jgi:hypothetical protein
MPPRPGGVETATMVSIVDSGFLLSLAIIRYSIPRIGVEAFPRSPASSTTPQR